MAEDDDFDDEGQHFAGGGEDGIVGLGGFLEGDETEEEEGVQVVQPGADEEVALEGAEVPAVFQAGLQLEVGW